MKLDLLHYLYFHRWNDSNNKIERCCNIYNKIIELCDNVATFLRTKQWYKTYSDCYVLWPVKKSRDKSPVRTLTSNEVVPIPIYWCGNQYEQLRVDCESLLVLNVATSRLAQSVQSRVQILSFAVTRVSPTYVVHIKTDMTPSHHKMKNNNHMESSQQWLWVWDTVTGKLGIC